jgi:beta-1,4-mannooligosaccharide/beta-1,4-mannosyl-N-acetylglucosamine phosphorylase
VVPFGDKFAGVFRVDNKRREMRIHSGKSPDGIRWDINEEPIEFVCDIPELRRFEHCYDPRVWWIEDRYYVTWCNGYHGPTIGVGYTYDFETFYQLENAFLPYNRNGVLFPKKINGKFAMLSRPSDTGHTPFGDIFYSESPDLCYWGRHRHVMGPTPQWGWQSTKIGAGPTPIETSEGWLLIYHGVLTSCNGYVYSMGAALLDIDQPWKVLYRTAPYILSPQQLYECVGDTPNVVFPCAALFDAPTGRIALYYGAADTVTCLACAQVDELIQYIKGNSMA